MVDRKILNLHVSLIASMVLILSFGFVSEVIPNLFGVQGDEAIYYFRVVEGYVYNYLLQFWQIALIWYLSRKLNAVWARQVSFFLMSWIFFNIVFQIFQVNELRTQMIFAFAALSATVYFLLEQYVERTD